MISSCSMQFPYMKTQQKHIALSYLQTSHYYKIYKMHTNKMYVMIDEQVY